jgi:hypothetical protein
VSSVWCRRRGPSWRDPVEAGRQGFRDLESCLANWLRAAGVEDGTRPGVTREESTELRELRKKS